MFVLLSEFLAVFLCGSEVVGGVFNFLVVLLEFRALLCSLLYRLLKCFELCV